MALAISGIPMLTGDEALAFREKAEEICYFMGISCYF